MHRAVSGNKTTTVSISDSGDNRANDKTSDKRGRSSTNYGQPTKLFSTAGTHLTRRLPRPCIPGKTKLRLREQAQRMTAAEIRLCREQKRVQARDAEWLGSGGVALMRGNLSGCYSHDGFEGESTLSSPHTITRSLVQQRRRVKNAED